MIRITPTLRISIGLASLTASLLLVGDLFGLFPDRGNLVLDARKKVCESLAVQLSVAATRSQYALVRDTVEAFVGRNPDVLSAAMRAADGAIIAQAGDHAKHWKASSTARSMPNHVKVPVFHGEKRWGNVEVSFESHRAEGLWGRLKESVYGLAIFIGFTGFLGYVAVLRRALRELDPAAVIPERVKAAFDVLSEGVLILDEKEQVVLANGAFANKAGRSVSSLIGCRASELDWCPRQGETEPQELPWTKALNEGRTQTGALVNLKRAGGALTAFSINGAPILDDRGRKRGVLVTLDDITELEGKNAELRETVTKLRDSERDIRRKSEELHRLATRDALTGCLNRRFFFDTFESLFQAAKRDKLELSCIMTDIDHFKAINDNHGHTVGDEAIKLFAEVLQSSSRADDVIGRYGGEEFCVLLPGLDSEQTGAIAERIRIAVEQKSPPRFASRLSFTASFGVASLNDGTPNPLQLVEQADQALYRAKDGGRNRVVRWPDQKVTPSAQGEAATVCGNRARRRVSEVVRAPAPPPRRAKVYSLCTPESTHGGYDPVTGLPTQVVFFDRLLQAVAQGKRHDKKHAVLSLRVQLPGQGNRVPGQDHVLKTVSGQLTGILRRTDIVAYLGIEKAAPMVSRLGSDEFGILLIELDDTEAVTWVVKRILDHISERIPIDGSPGCLATSIGISIYPHDGETPDTLIRNARAARKRAASTAGQKRYRFFSRKSNEQAWNQMLLENQLRRAIRNDELELLYQPKVHVATGWITGFEALVQWNHPEKGTVPPSEFIPLAESTGLIAPLGEWVLRAACQQARQWQLHFPETGVAVNLSAVQFQQGDLCHNVREQLAATGLNPRHLELEITESAIMRDAEGATAILRELTELGVKITIDDFGTGYSSLSYLRAFPVHSFKIDRSFLNDVVTDPRARSLYSAIAAMARGLGLQVVAEGVETSDQLAFVRGVQCDEAQGYLISKPVPGRDTRALLMEQGSGLPLVAGMEGAGASEISDKGERKSIGTF